MVLNITTLYSVIPVWMTLTLKQGHSVTRKLELVESFLKLQMFVRAEYRSIRGMTVKKSCNYGEYGSFEHLLFLSFCDKYFVGETFGLTSRRAFLAAL